ncbi:MAG: ATP-dependent DNA ligase [Actinomycetota bacterium]
MTPPASGSIRTPIKPMLAKLETEIPTGSDWRYEPKWDGFRCLITVRAKGVSIASRDDRPLERFFPELAEAVAEELPPGIYDGEILSAAGGKSEFDRLQLRLHPAESRIRMLAESAPACFVGFDLLEFERRKLLKEPFRTRFELLASAIAQVAEPCELPSRATCLRTPQTDDPATAQEWFEEFEECGVDGIIAKRADDPYRPGIRAMVKVKHRRTADCVVGGFRSGKEEVRSLLLGLFDTEGVLHYVGHCSNFNAKERRRLFEELSEHESTAGSFEGGRSPGGPSRWSGGKDLSWVSLRPELVCEVAYDKFENGRFRHVATLLRWRPDRRAETCSIDQVLPR